MKSAVETLNPTRVRLSIEVPFEELKDSLDAAYKKINQQVTVKGFRKGKIPNRVIDQRPKLRARAESALREARRRLQNLVEAVEGGAGAPSLLEAMHRREEEVQRLRGELNALSEPLEQKLAVMPTWVRQQLEDTAGLLSETPERTKAEFKRLGLSFVLRPVHTAGERPFLRAGGTTDFANLISGQCFQSSTTDSTHPRRAR